VAKSPAQRPQTQNQSANSTNEVWDFRNDGPNECGARKRLVRSMDRILGELPAIRELGFARQSGDAVDVYLGSGWSEDYLYWRWEATRFM